MQFFTRNLYGKCGFILTTISIPVNVETVSFLSSKNLPLRSLRRHRFYAVLEKTCFTLPCKVSLFLIDIAEKRLRMRHFRPSRRNLVPRAHVSFGADQKTRGLWERDCSRRDWRENIDLSNTLRRRLLTSW